jgi:hypothetical protein
MGWRGHMHGNVHAELAKQLKYTVGALTARAP